ncbi:hypothetical protein BLS_007053 [Venturia inaequalis]|uniref:Alpha/beta hydrolase fold-3 domain-containing protein n=1 Tax=Venturia inaequalis TaxID=5025 RepID=A0A8H3UB33_VENIN|nr:hypothetical protein BLS_007053 [Venturia inaequalis]
MASQTGSEFAYPNPIRPQFLDKMDPQFVEMYNKYQAPKLQAHHVSITEYRANPQEYTASIPPGPKPTVGSITVEKIPVTRPKGEIKIQIYRPTADAVISGGFGKEEGLPAHVNYHGDVDYRLAPEYPYPTQIWDSWEAFKWVFDNASFLGIDTSRVSVGGLSAGGHLAAVVGLMARDDPTIPPLKLQLLVVPTVDARWIPSKEYPGRDLDKVPYKSYVSCEDAPCLPLARMIWFVELWLGSDHDQRMKSADEWTASPIIASSHANLAPATIFTAEFDVLLSEGEAYHAKLQEAGTPSTYKMYAGVAHPFGHWDAILNKAKEYVKDTIAVIKEAHESSN